MSALDTPASTDGTAPHLNGADHRQGPGSSAIERAGFAPGTAAPTPVLHHNPVLVLVHDGSDPGIFAAVTSGIAEVLADGELLLAILAVGSDAPPTRLHDFLRRHRPAGVVLLPPLAEREDLVRICAEARVRCARLGPARDGAAPGQPSISVDERGAARDLVSWLIAKGHTRIGFVAGPDGSLSAQQRELGYLDAMADGGLDRGPALIVPGDNSFESGAQAGRLILEISPRPTAICASNDEMAVGVLHAAAQMTVAVPSELSVVGLDDTVHSSRSLPALTTMHIPWKRMGAAAAHRLSARKSSAPPESDLAARLVVRDSAGILS